MSYTRVTHSSPFSDGSASDLTVVLGAMATGLETVETTIAAETARATTAETARSNGKRKVGFIGDSITAVQNTYDPTGTGGVQYQGSPAMWAMLSSTRKNWELTVCAGVGGNTSTQMLARLQSEVLALGCDIVVISGMINDYAQSISVSQTITNITSMINQCLAAGATPILCTTTPAAVTGVNSSILTAFSQRRRRIIELGRQYNLPVVDLFTPIGDPLTGTIASTYNNDGTVHPTIAGYQQLGLAIAGVLDRVLPGSASGGILHAGDPDDLIGGYGFFGVDTNSDGIGDGWVVANNSFAGTIEPNSSFSIVTDAVLGKLQRITTTGSSGNSYLNRGWTSFIANHVYEVSGYISKNGTSTAGISFNTNTANARLNILGTDPNITKGHFCFRFAPGAGPSGSLYISAGAGTGTVDFAQLAIRDLTALGIA
jgi:lysophospholipase L1-like esterase